VASAAVPNCVAFNCNSHARVAAASANATLDCRLFGRCRRFYRQFRLLDGGGLGTQRGFCVNLLRGARHVRAHARPPRGAMAALPAACAAARASLGVQMKLLGLQQAFTFELVLARGNACRHAPRRRAGAPRRHGAIPPARAHDGLRRHCAARSRAARCCSLVLWAAAASARSPPFLVCMARTLFRLQPVLRSAQDFALAVAHLCASLA